jgi:hypothetical protein
MQLFVAELPPRSGTKQNGEQVELFEYVPCERTDRWRWVDKSSNNLLWIESRIPDPWNKEVRIGIGSIKSSSKKRTRERHPIRCQLLVFPAEGHEIPAVIEREIYASPYAYEQEETLASLHFPWEKRKDQPQMWLSYSFYSYRQVLLQQKDTKS